MKYIFFAISFGLLAFYVGLQFIDHFNPEVLQGKNVVITGASTGIGEQLAYQYARFGANIVITARRQEQLKKVIERCKEIGPSDGYYYYIPLDMSDKEAPSKLVEFAEKSLGRIDFIVLNHIIKTNMGEWLGSSENLTSLGKTMDVNFNAYVSVASHALNTLDRTNGSIIIISSVAGRVPQPYVSTYSASKFALEGFFGSLREDFRMKQLNISVTVCTIGLIGTENGMKGLNDFGARVASAAKPASPSDTALAIIKGGTQRFTRVHYPYMEARLVPLLYQIMPETISSLTRYMWERDVE